jgi:peroxiredoxin
MTGTPPVNLVDIPLQDPDGTLTTLAAYDADLLVIQLARYFGCLPCQEWLLDLDAHAEQFAALGGLPVAVGGSADYQARWLRDSKGVRLPLLLDPEQQVRDAVDVGRLGARLLNPVGLVSYGKALAHGFRPQRITRDTIQAPGVVILDRDRHIAWRYVGKRIGDYPPMRVVVDALAALPGDRSTD